jgi:hypothetical protein
MRLWLTALAYLCAGGALAWIGAARLADAWPRSTGSVSGPVSGIESGALAGGAGRMLLTVEGSARRFELAPVVPGLPTAGQLADAGRVSIDFDKQARERNGGVGPVHIVTGLSADGRVVFTPLAYRTSVAVWALLFVVPGSAMFGLGTAWIYRLSGNRYWQPRPWSWRRAQARAMAFAASATRDRRKTANGEWLH